MFKRILILVIKTLLILSAGAALILLLGRLYVGWYAGSRIYTPDAVPAERAAIVFGAGLWRNGSPTPVLQDRIDTAADLYFAGKVEKLLMSGDNRFVDYNEPGAMREYAISLGVPSEDIVLDYAGRRTYDTCYRAKAIFGLEKAILVTQGFHMPRALYTCNRLGLVSSGVVADGRIYRKVSLVYWNLRELPAILTALWQVNVSHPLPVLGDFEPIFPPTPTS
ncbi:MAG: ElyC/SanA/YdcF family protein [Anaerolineaceae bacterium]